MADFQRVVEFLRDLRQGPLQNVTEEITQSATEYAALCVQANERLRKCTSFLQQGLRTEALHLADESPNLLDLVAALDLPDAQAWADFCQNNGLPVPPPLQLDRAAQLNDAYAQDQPLEHLLSQHRMLALSRGPIGERLSILRKIASIDAASTTWEKDIRVFEKARLKELPTAFYNAVKTRDDAAITGLMTEVTQQPWFEPVPADLTAGVSDAYGRMQRAAVEIELRKMVEPLREAFAAQSFHECQALVQRWKNMMAAAGVVIISPDLTDEIRPVVAYVTEQEKRVEYMRKFRESSKAFGRLLDMDVPDAQLETGYARLKEFNEPIPEELTARYEAKGAGRQRVIDRKHRTRLIGIGASAAGVALVSLVVFVLVMRASDAKKWADKIERTLATKSLANLQAAQQDIAELRRTHPSFLSEASLAAAVRDTQAMQAAYDRDASTVQGLMGNFEGTAKTANVVAENKDASLDQLLSAVNSLNDALNQSNAAGDLSWADTPDKKYATVIAQLQGVLATVRTRAGTSVRQEVEADTAKVEAIGPTPANMSEASEQLGTIAARLRNLKALAGLDEETKGNVAALSQKVEQRRDTLTAASTMAGELDNVRQNATTTDDLKKALTGYIQRFPTDGRVADFTSAIDRLSLAKDAEAWREMTSAWAGQFAPSNVTVAQKRIDSLTAYLTAHPNSPMTATAAIYLDYLHRATDGLAEKGTWQQAFGDLFSNPMLTDLGYMETSDGQRFYVMGDIKRTDRRINDRMSVTFEALNPADVTKRMLVAVDPPVTLTTKTPTPAPHAKLVAEMSDELKTIDATNWDTWGFDAVNTLVKNKQISVTVKAILVAQALKTENLVADWAIGDAYTQALTELSRQKPENLSWLDTTHISAGTVRSLQGTLDAIPSAATMKEKLASAKTTLFKAVSFDVTSTAVLLKDEGGNWSVGSKTLATDGQLWTAVPASGTAVPADAGGATAAATGAATASATPAQAPGSLVQIGTVSGGKYALYENAVRELPQGTMVFITQP